MRKRRCVKWSTQVSRKQVYLRKEGDILLAEFERQENQRLQVEWEHQELSEILRTHQEREMQSTERVDIRK